MPHRHACEVHGGATRFAPTPTGHLHLGNARTALLDWLAGTSAGVRRILRVEDLDPKAIPEGCLEGQYADLAWLGLVYDEGPQSPGPVGPYRQSERGAIYRDALEELNARGLLFACWCSRKEVLAATRAPHASDYGAVYPGTCRPAAPRPLANLDALEERRGRKPALRLNVRAALEQLGVSHVEFTDAVAGPQSHDIAGTMGDFVVRRVDGAAAYQLACGADDALMGCTLVLRGSDLLASAARQALLLKLLDWPIPRYAHVGLVTDEEGRRLAKRDRDLSLTELRERGLSPADTRALLAGLSGLPATGDLGVLVESFDLGRLPTSSTPLPADWRAQLGLRATADSGRGGP